MEVVKRKAESGRIWKNSDESRENEGKLPREKQAVNLSAGFTMISIMNDTIYDILIQ
jgi:hypothetical protein